MAKKAGDSSDPSSIIHQLLVSCLGMWQRPHSQISVVHFCPTKSRGNTNIGTDTHSATKIAHAHAHTLPGSRLQLRLACEWLEYLHCGGPQVVGQRECTSNTSPGDAHHISPSVAPPHAHAPSLSNPYAILQAPKCHLIRLCDTLRASLNSIAVSLCPSLFISSVSPVLRCHTV